MTVRNTQEEYEIRSIFPVRINPSIVEGGNLYTGILGPKRSKRINRYAPVWKVAPLVVGASAIPSTLTCSTGVVDASPAAILTYQWRANGVDIPGATETSFTTDDSHDTMTISCRVTATNYLGTASANSNGIVATLVQPIYVHEAEYYTISGVEQQDHVTISTGGLAAISGLSVDDYQQVWGYDIAMATGMGIQDHLAILNQDIYTLIFPQVVKTLTMVNPGAESGDATGWTVLAGQLNSVVSSAKSGTRVFQSGSSSTSSRASQTITIDAADYALIDSNKALVSLGFWATNNTPFEASRQKVTCYLEAVDGSGVATRIDFFEQVNPEFKGTNTWYEFSGYPKALPPNTRSIRVVVAFTDTPTPCCQLDDFSVKLWSST